MPSHRRARTSGAGPFVRVLILALGAVAMTATPAAADPAGPTDYDTEVVAIEPATPAITVESIGGDSFIRLAVAPGHEVDVIGYQGEPYLRFRADGIVEQNENSPSRWLNDDRYGDAATPAFASADADPDWVVVATDGSYSWHDHRAHWMNEQKPPGAEPGDVILEAVVPLVVDGEAVDVGVRSTLLDPPSPIAPIAGAVAAAMSVAAGWLLGRLAGLSAAAAVWSIVALGVGVAAYLAMPAETGPSILDWALPLVGLAATAGALWLRRRGRPWEVWSILTLAAGAELIWWAWLRRESTLRSFIPTDAPFWLDRAAVAAAAVVGLTTVVMVLAEMAKPGSSPAAEA